MVDGTGAGLLLGFLADRVLGDPRRRHPVAGFGRAALALQKPLYADRRANGMLYELVLVGGTLAGGALAARAAGGRRTARTTGPVPYAFAVAAATWVVLGGRSLEREAAAVHALAEAGDLPAARLRVRALVGRDPSRLDGDELARACVESLAENTSDAVVAPLFWGAVAGIPGLLGYRAINTLDAMVGHRTPRWERFGWAAARVDDVANLVPARVATALTAVLSRRPREVLRVVRRDAPAHPSPNAGPIESAFAATLGVRLGGSNVYAGVAENRGTLGDGRSVRLDDVPRAIRLSGRLSWATVAAVLALRGVGRAVRAWSGRR
ncbi:adenosylcobinamide-phosphate synthase CbiB [Cumulibacter manganitolerans]|uniref:adenosylcobinamide-phosphate synthase CbiB n=1 Tax=Cumulibacter manganitolerans TaxID=1884992 RepID=UPI001E4847B4|nr:adenosylcobinamide-phosphate synthase CbiB [Cumulibacter manganitolerans]